MNYKSKLLSVFLSAGILLNSTSMAFAGQDEDRSQPEKEPCLGVLLLEKIKMSIMADYMYRVIGEEEETEFAIADYDLDIKHNHNEVCGFDIDHNIFYSYDKNDKELSLVGENGAKMINYGPSDYDGCPLRPAWEEQIDKRNIENIRIYGIEHIGDFAFDDYVNLKTVKMLGVESIGYSVFRRTGLEELKVPNSVIHIADGAFNGMGFVLKSVTLPKRFESRISDILGMTYLEGKTYNLKIEYTE